jgi:hypothetical protein
VPKSDKQQNVAVNGEMLLFKCEFEINEGKTEHANNAVANNDRPQIQSKTIDQPYNGAGKNDQHHGQAQVTYAFGLPRFVNLGHKGDGA